MRPAHPRLTLAFALLALVLASGAAMADQACFSWTSNGQGTVSFNASRTSPTPPHLIYWYVWNFGDGNGGGPSGDPTFSHTYAAPPPYDFTVTLSVLFLPNYNQVNVSCDVWAWVLPFGPQPPSFGTCCSS